MWGSIAGAVIGGLLANEGQEDANESNREIAENNSAFNAEQVALNRDFQREMSNTSYQRAVVDMKSAGLNPMLAYSQGGASTPSGSSANAVQPPPMQNARAAGVNSALQIMQQSNLRAQTQNTEAQTDKTRAETDLIRGTTPYNIDIAENKRIISNVERIFANARQDNVRDLTDGEVAKLRGEISRLAEQGKLLRAQTGVAKIDALLKNLSVPERLAIHDHFTKYRSWHTDTGAFLGQATSAAGAAAKLPGAFRPWRR